MTETQEWRRRAEAVRFDARPVIGGVRVEPQADPSIDSVSPRNGSVLHRFSAGSANDADQAVASARQAFEQGRWRNLSPLIRKSILFGFADAIEKECEELALLDCLEMGKPIAQALSDAAACGHIIRYFAEWADKTYGDAAPTMPGAVFYNRREPRGVVAAIVPWNYPLPNAALKIGPALAAGNSMVLKPSELSPSSALRLAEIAVSVGIPPGALNVLPGLGRTAGAALAAHPDVDLIAFTGSTTTGRELMRLASQASLRPLQLECGGKSANLVLADFPDLETVAADVAQRIFTNQGQLCVAGARLIVHQDRKAELLKKVIGHAEALRIGDPLDPNTTFGPLASQLRLDHVLRDVRQGISDGAQAVHGGQRAKQAGDGFFMQPTVLDDVRPEMSVAQADIFGPVLSVMTFQTVDEALALANASPYGLSATVWTQDLGAAGRLIDGLRAGRVTVLAAAPDPRAAAAPLAAEPFGQSGIGAEGGREGYELYTRLKAVEIHY